MISPGVNYFRALLAKASRYHIIRFLIVGTLNTGFSYVIYAGILYIGWSYQLANLIALVLGILFSFKTQGRLVFKNTDNRLFGRFLISWVLIYLGTITLIGRIIALGFDAYTAGALALPFSIALSYLMQKYYVFRTDFKNHNPSSLK